MLGLMNIAICLLFGVLLRRRDEFRIHGPGILNTLVIDLFLPALILAYIPDLGKNYSASAVLFPALMPWIVFLIAIIVINLFGKFFRWKRETIGVLILVSGLGNTSFVGFPMVEAFIGAHAISTAIIVDQLGSFLIVSTLATIIAAYYSDGDTSLKHILHKVFTFAPFLALLVALAITPFAPFPHLSEVLKKLGAPMIPLAIIAMGLQLSLDQRNIQKYIKELLCSLSYKLILAPAIILVLYVFYFKQHGEAAQTTIAEAAMSPMFSASIVATRFKLDPELASLVIFVGVILSFITTPVWILWTRWV